MSNYVELPIDKIELDKSNPRVGTFIDQYDEAALDSNTMALLLGTGADECASLRESIRENGGIINPIIVNKIDDDKYIVIEGNTRLQIYRDFIKKNEPGDWGTIRAIVYDELEDEEAHSIRLLAHLVGPREWKPYAKAKYLNHLANEEHMSMSRIVAYCGGNSKAAEIKHMIDAYQDMQDFYRPLCDDSAFDTKKFTGFVELQRGPILDSLALHGYTKTDFSQWMADDRFSKLEDVRRLPEILNSKKASDVFFKENSREAIKILNVEEKSEASLKDYPYELLAKELAKKMNDLSISEILLLRNDVDYANKLASLRDVVDKVQFVLDEVDRI